MTMQRTQPQLSYRLRPALTPEDRATVFALRERIYRSAGKASEGGYQSPLDATGEAFLLLRGDRAIGTFSFCNFQREAAARREAAGQWDLSEAALESSLSVYFLGIEAGERRAEALKFVFGEVFKYLVRHRLTSIYVLADARLTRRYRWLGLRPVGARVMSVFPKSGWLSLLHTRQIRAGVYGLHADPLRWNWYLRAPTAELLREGAFANPRAVIALYHLYSLFAPPARAAEACASALYLRSTPSSKKVVYVRTL